MGKKANTLQFSNFRMHKTIRPIKQNSMANFQYFQKINKIYIIILLCCLEHKFQV